jgi:hypothetical protein
MNPFLLQTRDVDPDGRRLPIKLDTTTNGEFAPIPLDPSLRHANALASEWAGKFARKLAQNSQIVLDVCVRRGFYSPCVQCSACARG